LDSPDAIINLSGAGLGDHRWTAHYKNIIRTSRIEPTAVLARAIASATVKPRVLLNASGVGFYGDTGDRVVTEDAESGVGFLSEVCRAWEAATRPAEDVGVRVVHLRTSPVLAASGGLLKRMVPIFKVGLGGRLGSGRQYLPWVSLADWLGAVTYLLDSDISGAANICAPNPVVNAEFTRVLANELHRSAVLAVPTFALKLALGEFSIEALTGQRALPAVLANAGYQFKHPELDEALRWALTH
jgi:uncharacterized protein (TIGR01777 family)